MVTGADNQPLAAPPSRNRLVAGWRAPHIVATIVALVTLIPFASLFVLATGDASGVWPHLIRNVIPQATGQTVLLVAGVGLFSSLVGASTAWLVSRYRFFGRGFLHWALVIPLAVPTYLSAFCFVELLNFTGPVQTAVRELGGFRTPADYWFPDVRSLPGAIFVMTAVLYPYVYLTCRLVFEMQGSAIIDTSRVLGTGGFRLFVRVAAPLARPAVAAGAMLAMLEALNDIGAVETLGVRTLTFSIFDTWLNRSSLAGAAQIACVMLVFVGLLSALERQARGGRRYAPKGSAARSHSLVPLSGWHGALAFLACALPPAIGFAAPVGLMLSFAWKRPDQFADPALYSAAANSLTVSALAALATVMAALVILAAQRRRPPRWLAVLLRASTLGYAVPGSVLAIGTLFALTRFDNGLDAFLRDHFGVSTGLLLSGGAAIIVYGVSVRFIAIAHGSLESAYSRLSDHVAMAARTLGRSEAQTLFGVELVLLRRAIATAGLFVFVDTMKELSATVLLRPFNFSTLAIFVYEKASRALFEDSTVAALAIVAIGVVPVLLLSRVQRGGREMRGEDGRKRKQRARAR